MLRRHIACPTCGAQLALPAEQAPGSRARCGICGTLFRVPGTGVERVFEERERGRDPLLAAPRKHRARAGVFLARMFN